MAESKAGLSLLFFTLGGTFILAWLSAAITGCLGPCTTLAVGPFTQTNPINSLLTLNFVQFFEGLINGIATVLGTFAASLNPLYSGPSVASVVNGLITGVAGFILVLIGIFGKDIVDQDMFIAIGVVLMLLGSFVAPATLFNQLPLGLGTILTYVDDFFAALGAYLMAKGAQTTPTVLLGYWYFVEIGIMIFFLVMGLARGKGLWFIFDMIFSAFVAIDIAYSNFTLTFFNSLGAAIPFDGGLTLLIVPIMFILASVVGAYESTIN